MPAIAYWPGRIQPGSVTSQTALGMDMFPTVLSITGAKLPARLKLDGIDLLDMLIKDKKLPERTLFWRYRKEKAVRKGPWKLLIQGDKVKLFNRDEDISEKKNLAEDKPELVQSLQAEFAAWEQDVTAGVEFRA